MNTDIKITVVIKKTESNDLQQPQAVKVERQVDLDQGSKLPRLRGFDPRAYLPLVISVVFHVIDFINNMMS
ncbi:MAG: hypothetical protein CTY16_08815 [Methylobacter sp.]|nr:MAG: hypothetical protein CTY16_08815 [Methylobacter sp.]